MNERSNALDPESLLAQAGWVRALARSLARGDEVEDLVQETWRIALERPPQVRDERGLRAWLRTVLSNQARRRRRDTLAHCDIEARLHRERHNETQDDAHTRSLLQKRLADAVHELDEPYRGAIVLRYFDGLDARAIAERQRVSHDAARQRISRGLATLRSQLDREYDGGRAQWVAFAGSLFEHAAPAPWITGGALMGAKWMGVAAIAVIGLASWWWWRTESAELAGERTNVVASAKLDAPNENEAANAVVAHSEATERVALEDSAQLVAAPRAIDRERDLHGIVVDAVRRPVAGARVTVVQHAFAELEVLDLDPAQRASSHVRIAEQTTDEAGEFVIPLETGRSYDLVVEAAGFAPGSASHCHAGERIEITLDAGATLSGRVMRRLDNSPVVGATVELRYSRELHLKQTVEAVRVETDADGRYRFDNLPSGERLVGVFPLVDAPSGWIHATLAPGRAIEQDFRVEAGQRLRGRVVDRDTRAPIAGAVVGERWTMHRTVRTDARGEFEFPGLATSGYYEIGVRADGYGRIDQTVQAPGAETVGVVEVALLRGRTLRGRVIDRNGAPIEDAYVATPAVELDGLGTAQQLDWPSTRTRADGTYQLEDVRRDMQHSLFVQKAGYGVGSYEVDDRDVVNDVLTIPDVVLDAGAIVRGVVVDQDGEPYVARVVHLTGRNRDGSVWNERDPSQASRYIVDRSTRTDDLGRFAFADVAIGDYDLAAPPRGAEDDVRKRIAVDGPEPVTGVELVLPRGLSIAGRVIGPDGRGVHGWLVLEARDDPSRGLMQQYTEQDGTFEVRGLPAGVYSGVVYPTYLESVAVSERLARATIPEVAAGRKDVIVHAARAALIGGRVLDADGSAAVGVTVELWLDGERDGENGGVTAADGRFGVWVAENSGPYELRATGRIRQEGALQQVETFPPDRSASVRGVTPGDGRQHELRLP